MNLEQQVVMLLPWLLSAITIFTMWKAGDLKRSAWLVGLGNQALWLVWIIFSHSWGLLPLTAALTFVYTRNYIRWAQAPQEEMTADTIAKMVAAAGSNDVSLKDGPGFTGTYWISANDLYFRITGRHLNADFESGAIPRNEMMETVAKR